MRRVARQHSRGRGKPKVGQLLELRRAPGPPSLGRPERPPQAEGLPHRAGYMWGMLLPLLAATALAAPPQRIVSTAPAITETLFVLGLGSRVVGVSSYCVHPPEAATRTKIGGYLRPDVEAIVALMPDLTIVQYSPAGLAQQLERMRLPAVELRDGDLEQALANMMLIGRRAGVPERAARLVAGIRQRLNAVRQRTATRPRRSVLFIVGRSPGRLDGMVAVGKGSFLNGLIEIAGGVNALAGTPLGYPKISLEGVLAMNPDVIIDMGDMADTARASREHQREVTELWGSRPSLKAVKARRLYAVASEIFVVPGPRMVETAEAFEKMIHPEASR